MKTLLATESSSAIILIMNRTKLLENLNYFFVTLVLIFCFSSRVWSTPNPEPLAPSSNQSPDIERQTIEDEAVMDSLIIPDINTQLMNRTYSSRTFNIIHNFSVTISEYFGPSKDNKMKILTLLGIDYRHLWKANNWIHAGFSLANQLNPHIYTQFETKSHTSFSSLKSYFYSFQLEVDTDQGLGSLMAWNYYMLGAGLRFQLFSWSDLMLEFYPISSRGIATEIKLNILMF